MNQIWKRILDEFDSFIKSSFIRQKMIIIKIEINNANSNQKPRRTRMNRLSMQQPEFIQRNETVVSNDSMDEEMC